MTRVSPEDVAKLIGRVLMAEQPKRRHSIGHMAGMAALLEALPQSLADAVLARRFNG